MITHHMEFWARTRIREELEVAATRRLLRAAAAERPAGPSWRARLAAVFARRVLRRVGPAEAA